ncbi:hypothetical protein MLD38_024856 [Melastoma candidum]|uniref:Uncharacterized protein n=1 Tax=Melastoma candidum TaxID=119954 RepID=A0ACB9NTI8_9MYRT|nr:hypothetical protein MLD38_024856 [Melastoma candidum]
MAEEKMVRVCVTGAGGYIASWLVKLLLSKGYLVHGTVRDPGNPKNGHLKSLENAPDRLRLFKADILDYDRILAAVSGSAGVFHLACPVPLDKVENPEVDLLEPALTGTRNVLKASLEAKVRKVVVVSSVTTVAMTADPRPKDQPLDETVWSDVEYCKLREYWYCVAKTLAEMEALEFSKRTGLNITTICPSITIGPMLQRTLNASSSYFLEIMKGTKPLENIGTCFVDVRDTAEAILLVYESPEAEGRYICSASETSMKELVSMLKEVYPAYNYQKSYEEVQNAVSLSSVKLQNLGWKHRAFKETLNDTIHNYREAESLSTNGTAS